MREHGTEGWGLPSKIHVAHAVGSTFLDSFHDLLLTLSSACFPLSQPRSTLSVSFFLNNFFYYFQAYKTTYCLDIYTPHKVITAPPAKWRNLCCGVFSFPSHLSLKELIRIEMANGQEATGDAKEKHGPCLIHKSDNLLPLAMHRIFLALCWLAL